MKLLTLNTHSWIEDKADLKFEQLIEHLMLENYDVIALQEVNQAIASPHISIQPASFIPVKNQAPLRQNNFAYCIVERLKQAGYTYYFSWQLSHIGYEIFEEGNAILAKTRFSAKALTVSDKHDITDYRTRVNLVATFDSEKFSVASCHFSWWDTPNTGFASEWQNFCHQTITDKNEWIVCGDFNAPAFETAYQLVMDTNKLEDSYKIAKIREGEATIKQKIDGWEDNTKPLRIDYIFVPKQVEVTRYQRVLDGSHSPIVSDHFGVQITMDL